MLMRMIFASALALTSSGAVACFICDELVEFTPRTAECFLEKVPEYLSQGAEDEVGRVVVNLTVCSEARAALDSFPSLTTAPSEEPAQVLMINTLETSSVSCLADALSARTITGVVTRSWPGMHR